MQCPQCGSVMHEEHHGVALDRCASCGGIWFDADELRAVLKRPVSTQLVTGAPDGAKDIENAPYRCPRCIAPILSGRSSHGVQIHACDECKGIFVSSKAFLKIVDCASYGAKEVGLDLLIMGPDIAVSVSSLLEVLVDIFSGW